MIGQYISDIIFNIFVFNKKDFYAVITEISPIASYMAATTSGFLNGLTEPYIDDISSVAFRNILYVYSNDYYSRLVKEEDIVDEINTSELIVDTIAVVIIFCVFSRSARCDFYNHKLQKCGLISVSEENQDVFSSIIIIFSINLYVYYRYKRNNDSKSSLDKSINMVYEQ